MCMLYTCCVYIFHNMLYMYTHIYTDIYIFLIGCIYVCVCVYSHANKKIHKDYSSLRLDLVIWDRSGRKRGC